jgi:hypothetical protein
MSLSEHTKAQKRQRSQEALDHAQTLDTEATSDSAADEPIDAEATSEVLKGCEGIRPLEGRATAAWLDRRLKIGPAAVMRPAEARNWSHK